MATVLKGNHKGKKTNIHQWCNDWFSTDLGIISPTNLQLTPEEVAMIWDANIRGQCGIMFSLFTLDVYTGKFKRIRRMRAQKQ